MTACGRVCAYALPARPGCTCAAAALPVAAPQTARCQRRGTARLQASSPFQSALPWRSVLCNVEFAAEGRQGCVFPGLVLWWPIVVVARPTDHPATSLRAGQKVQIIRVQPAKPHQACPQFVILHINHEASHHASTASALLLHPTSTAAAVALLGSACQDAKGQSSR